jgi:kinesin family member 5
MYGSDKINHYDQDGLGIIPRVAK